MGVVRHHHPGQDLERMRLPHPQDDLAQIIDAINQETTGPLREITVKK